MLHTRLNEENSYYFNMCSIISVKNFHSPLLSLCLEQFLRVLFVLPWWLDAEAETPVLWPPHAKSWLTHWKRAWCWEGLGAGEGDDRGWDGWMASPTWWTWVWVSSRSWWWTGRPGVLRFMGSQRVGHDWAIKLNWRWTKLVAQRVKSLPAMQETHVLSLGSFPGEGMATHSSILTWRFPWTQEPRGLQSIGLHRVDMTEQLTLFTRISYTYW